MCFVTIVVLFDSTRSDTSLQVFMSAQGSLITLKRQYRMSSTSRWIHFCLCNGQPSERLGHLGIRWDAVGR
jgi:hypothetical protein